MLQDTRGVTDASLLALAANCPKLQHVWLLCVAFFVILFHDPCETFSETWSDRLELSCSLVLFVLSCTLSHGDKLSSTYLSFFVVQLFCNPRTLLSHNLFYFFNIFRFDETHPQVSDVGIVSLAQSCRHLRDIAFSCVSMTDASLIALAENCQGLRSLRFATNDRQIGITDAVRVPRCVESHDDRARRSSCFAITHTHIHTHTHTHTHTR